MLQLLTGPQCFSFCHLGPTEMDECFSLTLPAPKKNECFSCWHLGPMEMMHVLTFCTSGPEEMINVSVIGISGLLENGRLYRVSTLGFDRRCCLSWHLRPVEKWPSVSGVNIGREVFS